LLDSDHNTEEVRLDSPENNRHDQVKLANCCARPHRARLANCEPVISGEFCKQLGSYREFYKMAIPANSIASAIAYAIEQPADVEIDEIVISAHRPGFLS
jgi:hypothetical protein